MSARKIRPERLVNAATIASMAGVTRAAVSHWEKDPRWAFPRPLETPGVLGFRLWDRRDVEAWIRWRAGLPPAG